ncbi:MAG: DNA topoisomerase VI subunit B [Candidatus Aenigmatarchaeota archaeon]
MSKEEPKMDVEKYKQVSISEFFEKNRHLLGYDSKIKAMLIIVKEGVDNALDATEEAGIFPEIYVKIEELEKEKYKIVIRDNGPGIVKKQIPKIFGTLLYGSKFHKLRQSRGQQGLGISMAVLYSQLTTGEPTEILSSIGDGKTHKYKLKIDVKKNEPEVMNDEFLDGKDWRGTQVTFICEGVYREHKQSVLEYLKQTAISNPYANITFDAPTGKIEFKKGVENLPKQPKEIKPHLHGVELGIMMRMLQDTAARSIAGFLTSEFSRTGKTTVDEICKKAEIDCRISPRKITDADVVRIIKSIKEVRLTRPPTDCLSPLGSTSTESGLKKELDPEFVATITRPPEVYRGWPFQIEVGIAYGGSITESKLMRFANRVPLLYQQGDCAITKAASEIDWRRYGFDSDKLPSGPVVIFVHMISVWVPFTSESKEAVASYPIIIKEVKLALQECARKVSLYLSGIRKAQAVAERKSIFERYAHETAVALNELTGTSIEDMEKKIKDIVNERWEDIDIYQKNNNSNGEKEDAEIEEANDKKEETETEKKKPEEKKETEEKSKEGE